MDLMTIIVIAVAGLIAIGLTAWMLNRAWGDFPDRVGRLDSQNLPPLSSVSPLVPPALKPQFESEADEYADEDEDAERDLPAGAPQADLIPVTHELIRRAAEHALERGGSPYATYFVRHGDQLFLAAHRIADPVERAQVVRLFQGLNSGDMSNLDFAEAIKIIQKFGR